MHGFETHGRNRVLIICLRAEMSELIKQDFDGSPMIRDLEHFFHFPLAAGIPRRDWRLCASNALDFSSRQNLLALGLEELIFQRCGAEVWNQNPQGDSPSFEPGDWKGGVKTPPFPLHGVKSRLGRRRCTSLPPSWPRLPGADDASRAAPRKWNESWSPAVQPGKARPVARAPQR